MADNKVVVDASGAEASFDDESLNLGYPSPTRLVEKVGAGDSSPKPGTVLVANNYGVSQWAKVETYMINQSVSGVARWVFPFEASSGYNQGTGGTGSVINFDGRKVRLQAGDATHTGFATLSAVMTEDGATFLGGNGNPRFYGEVYVGTAMSAKHEIYVGFGGISNAANGHNFGETHMGFKIIGGTVSATQSDGTNGEVAAIVYDGGTGVGSHLEFFVNKVSETQVDYYFRKDGSGNFTLAASLTASIPLMNNTGLNGCQWSCATGVGTNGPLYMRVYGAYFEKN